MRFISCSHKLGRIKDKNPNGDEVIITMYGVWVEDEDAEYFVNKLYPVFCPAIKTFKQQRAVFFATPTQKQMKEKDNA